MAELRQVYKCFFCSNVVVVLRGGAGELSCCGKTMELMAEKSEDSEKEKHAPVIEKTKTGVRIFVGATPHPMEKDHHIEWIEIIANGDNQRKYLSLEERPRTEFNVQAENFVARAFCNQHGLWIGLSEK